MKNFFLLILFAGIFLSKGLAEANSIISLPNPFFKVPEASTLLLLGVALIGLALYAWKKLKK